MKLSRSQKAEIRDRRKNGENIRTIAKDYGVHWRDALELCWDVESKRAIVARVSQAIRNHPFETNEQIAKRCHVTPDQVQERRDARIARGAESPTHWTDADNDLTGKIVPAAWLKRHCSRGERNLRQIQAIIQQGVTLADIRHSAALAGLEVRPDNVVYNPALTPRNPVPSGASAPRVYKVGATGVRRIK